MKPQIPPELWISNLLQAAKLISNRELQETRWLAPDALAWETPDEAINTLDDSVLDGFVEQFADAFSPVQAKAVIEFRDEVGRYCRATPQHLEPAVILTDPRWQCVREKAAAFIKAFEGSWPKSIT
jgi:hypothetical protein